MVSMAVVGATGAVGREVLEILESRCFPVSEIRLFASENSRGRELATPKGLRRTRVLTENSFKGVDIAIFSAGSSISRDWAPLAVESKCIVIDNSSAFRMNPQVPLVVPEINARDLDWHNRIIANPNCTTAITLMALWPLHKEFGVKRIFAASQQAVSGAGSRGIAELDEQLVAHREHERGPAPKLFPHPIAHNLFPQVGTFRPSGYTDEEEKMVNEGRKIMGLPDFAASVTCTRVPVYRAHSIAVSAEFERPVDVRRAHEVLANFEGLMFMDQAADGCPTPELASGKDDCFVGRVRKDSAFENGLSFFVCGDQIRKGAALNAVQIAECLIKK